MKKRNVYVVKQIVYDCNYNKIEEYTIGIYSNMQKAIKELQQRYENMKNKIDILNYLYEIKKSSGYAYFKYSLNENIEKIHILYEASRERLI